MSEKITARDTGIRGKALCQFFDRSVLLYRLGKIYLVNPADGQKMRKITLPIEKWKRVASLFRLPERLAHVEVRWAYPIGGYWAFVFYGNHLWRINAETGEYYQEEVELKGKPLSFAEIKEISGFENSYVIGDYWGNPRREAVHIHQKCIGDRKWHIAFTFPPGTVRHIHGIVPDKQHGCVYILTGDEDAESGIWIARNNFAEVKALYVGKQSYRACQLFLYDEDIFYLTDAPSEENHLYCICGEKIVQKELLRGSCIYGLVRENGGFFSTTCEPDAHAHSKFRYWLTNKPGAGVKDASIDVFGVLGGQICNIKSFSHDRLPLRLFQYAAATFANSVCDEVYFTPECVKKYDQHVFKIEVTKDL